MTSAFWAWLVLHWPHILAAWAAVSPVIEYQLGIKAKDDPARAASILEAARRAGEWVRTKLAGKSAGKAGKAMGSGNEIAESVTVDKPLRDVGRLVVDVLAKLGAGMHPQDLIGVEFAALSTAMTELGLILPDAKADPQASINAAALTGADISGFLVAHLGSKAPAAAPGK